MRAAVALLLLVTACAHAPNTSCTCAPKPQPEEVAVLQDWALSRCIAKVAEGQLAGQDASSTAAAFLERGRGGIEVYEQIDRMIDGVLARRYSGSVPGDYNLLKCLELYHSAGLADLARDAN